MRRELADFGRLAKADHTISQTLADYRSGVLLPSRKGRPLTAEQRAIHSALDRYLGRRRSVKLTVFEYDDFLVSFASGEATIATRWGTAINKDNYKRSIRLACQRAGIDEITPYELRHTAIAHRVDAVGSAAPVADWAGTGELMIWKHYRHKLRVVRLPPPDYVRAVE